MSPRDRAGDRLGDRAEAVFDAMLTDRSHDLHPADREEAGAFWHWLGEQPRPARIDLPPLRRAPAPWRWAAAVVVGLGGLGALSPVIGGGESSPYVAHHETGRAERRVVRLADGSTVTLAAESSIDLRFTDKERHLTLRHGQALFDVAHDTARPFVVETVHGDVTAVGTAFDVVVGWQDAEVTVVEGTVRVALPGDGRNQRDPILKLATKGEQIAFGTTVRAGSRTGFIRQSESVDIDAATAWTRGQLIFHGQPLAEVIETVNRYAATPADRLILTDRRAANTPVFGIVNQGDGSAIRSLIADPTTVGVAAK